METTTLLAPCWFQWRVFGDGSAMSWLKHTKVDVSNIHRMRNMYTGFEKMDRLGQLAKVLRSEAKAGDKIIVQFDEMFVFHGDFPYSQFVAEMEQLLLDLIRDNKVKRIVICTIPPHPSRLDDQVY